MILDALNAYCSFRFLTSQDVIRKEFLSPSSSFYLNKVPHTVREILFAPNRGSLISEFEYIRHPI